MGPTLAEEIRTLLERQQSGKDALHVWNVFPALAAKMLTVIDGVDTLRSRIAVLEDERNGLQMAIEEMGEVHDCITTRMNTRIVALEKESAHLRWEAECLQVEVR